MGATTISLSGREYAITPMPPVKACVFSARVAKLLAGAMGGVAELVGAANKDAAALQALSEGLANVDVDQYDQLAKQAVSYVSCEAGKLSNVSVFDDWFATNPGDLHKVCVWAIWTHAAPFLLGGQQDWSTVFEGKL